MIGYYAHGHGAGHCNYASILGRVFLDKIIVFTDREPAFDRNVKIKTLPNENTDGTEFDRDTFPEPCTLHYAPVNLKKITERNRIILNSISKYGVKFLIVDVSVEIAMLARVSSVPYVYVRLMGDRDDLGHTAAYEGAAFLLAYFPPEMESLDTPIWVRRKTIYLGFLSKFLFNDNVPREPDEYKVASKPILLKVNGFGGSNYMDLNHLRNDFDLFSIGPNRSEIRIDTIQNIGIVASIRPFLLFADIIVAACGLNITSEILSLKKGFVAVPEHRHFREQEKMAEQLETLNLAINTKRYSNISDAVQAFQRSKKTICSIDLKKLYEFRDNLTAMNFRVDRVWEIYTDESESEVLSTGSYRI